ncbi:hypothetical protein CAC42_26 [Sphaceloma murrayae]|uniref:SWIM-type domain-containing protein n=1 Tax=Sphaceloma murrayae TaxID=2082308 RepID=A0A2K1QSE1_9PEZI|nr:hypothetical protein CAC42_26 [Sphaceloma murrayae]
MASPRRQRSTTSRGRGRRTGPSSRPTRRSDRQRHQAQHSSPGSSDSPGDSDHENVQHNPFLRQRSDDTMDSGADTPPSDLVLNPSGRLLYDLENFTPVERAKIARARTSAHAPWFHIPRFTEITDPNGNIDFCVDMLSHQRVVLQAPKRYSHPADLADPEKPRPKIHNQRPLTCTCTKSVRGPKTPVCEHIWYFQERVVSSLFRQPQTQPVSFDTTSAMVQLPNEDHPQYLYNLFDDLKNGILDDLDLTSYMPDEELNYQKTSQHVLCVASGSNMLPNEMFSNDQPHSPTEFASRRICDLLLQRASSDSTIHEQIKKLLTPQVIQRTLLDRLQDRISTIIIQDLPEVHPNDMHGIASIVSRLRRIARSMADYDAMYTGRNALLDITRNRLARYILSIISATLQAPALFAQAILPPISPEGFFLVRELVQFTDVCDDNMRLGARDLSVRLLDSGAPIAYVEALEQAVGGWRHIDEEGFSD